MNAIITNSLEGIFSSPLDNATIIGCGAIGSKIAIELARMGVNEIELFDFDHVEAHNLCNQVFTLNDVGLKKTEALQRIIDSICSAKIATDEKFVDQKPIHPIVFLCVDSMSERKRIMDTLLKNSNVYYVIETRMGIDELRVYVASALTYDKWKSASDYDDSTAERSACGTSLSVGATSSMCSSIAVWQYMKMYRKDNKPEFETIWGAHPMGVLTSG